MAVLRFKVHGNGTCKSVKYTDEINLRFSFQRTYSHLLKLVFLVIFGTSLTSCVTYRNTKTDQNNNSGEITMLEITTCQTALNVTDVAKYFCNNLTEYFNTYKYYRISSEVYNENEKQKHISTTRITKRGSIYNVEYIGCSGRFTISFSNNVFNQAEEIITFGRLTVLGNAIRSKIYDTFSAWLQRVEIALKANSNSYLYQSDLEAGVEVENWYNSLSVINK
jgi:hypothetical protein